jgi:hypothetical protein
MGWRLLWLEGMVGTGGGVLGLADLFGRLAERPPADRPETDLAPF